MIQLIAPFNTPETVVILPNPEFADTRALTSSVNIKQAIDGTLYVYKKTKQHEKLEWSFYLTPLKAEELKAFVDYYIARYIKVVDKDGNVWKVLMTTDTFQYSSKTRDNWIEVQLEFQGVPIGA